jgi:hypothetical protein
MPQRFKPTNIGADIPLLADDLVIAGGTPAPLEGGGFQYTRVRVERSGYCEQADYHSMPSGIHFEHTDEALSTEQLRMVEAHLEALGRHFPSGGIFAEPNDAAQSLCFWYNGQSLEIVLPTVEDILVSHRAISCFKSTLGMIHCFARPRRGGFPV